MVDLVNEVDVRIHAAEIQAPASAIYSFENSFKMISFFN
jgi:hypothetical protein